jgi:hypothetical protein
MVARVTAGESGGHVEVQAIHGQDGMELMRGAERDGDVPFAAALVDFAGFAEPIQDLQVVASTVEPGEYKLLSRHKLFPITIEVDRVQSDEVPLQGLFEAEYRTEVTWSTDENGEPAISQETKTFAPRGFGGTAVD